MFNLSMPELALIGVVALLVLGPERLPGAARTAGALLRRAQRSWSGLRADIERELASEELTRQLKQTRDELGMDQLEQDLRSAGEDIQRDLDRTGKDLGRGLDPRLPDPERRDDNAPTGNDERT